MRKKERERNPKLLMSDIKTWRLCFSPTVNTTLSMELILLNLSWFSNQEMTSVLSHSLMSLNHLGKTASHPLEMWMYVYLISQDTESVCDQEKLRCHLKYIQLSTYHYRVNLNKDFVSIWKWRALFLTVLFQTQLKKTVLVLDSDWDL